MLVSDVPPCRTITFEGGQLDGEPAVLEFAAFPAAVASEGGGLPEPELAGATLQLDVPAFFFGCRRFVVFVGL
jgi:hypothetical protein